MRELTVLVIDDEQEMREKIASKIRKCASQASVEIRIDEKDFGDAEAAIRDQFYDVAFVDIFDRTQSGDVPVGADMLALLKEHRPTCMRVMMTNQTEGVDEITAVVNELHPSNSEVNFLFHKAITKDRYCDNFLSQIVERLITPVVEVQDDGSGQGFQSVFEATRDAMEIFVNKWTTKNKPNFKPEWWVMTKRELAYVFSKLFSDTSMYDESISEDESEDPMPITGVRLHSLTGGQTPTCVWLGMPTGAANDERAWCVVKIGPKPLIMKEHLRYERYVKFNASPARRVVLLDFVKADTIGAICYTLAGDIPREDTSEGESRLAVPQTLESLFKTSSPLTPYCLQDLFDPDPKLKHWFRIRTPEQDESSTLWQHYDCFTHSRFWKEGLENFLNRVDADNKANGEKFEFPTNKNHRELRAILKKPASDIGDQSVAVGGVSDEGQHSLECKVNVPQIIRNDGAISSQGFCRCIVHGDMHGGNALITNDYSTKASLTTEEELLRDPYARSSLKGIRIDFGNTGPGPLGADFAKLEASVRTAQINHGQTTIGQVLLDAQYDRLVLEKIWGVSVDELFLQADEGDAWEEWCAWSRDYLEGTGFPLWARWACQIGWLARKNFGSALSPEEYVATCLCSAYADLRHYDNENDKTGQLCKLRLVVWISKLYDYFHEIKPTANAGQQDQTVVQDS